MKAMRISQATKDKDSDRKLRELVLYIAQRCQSDDSFGATKQNKLLFYADFLAYRSFGKSITGQEYFRLERGPCPRRWVPVKKKMEAASEIVVNKVKYYGYPQERTVPLRQADLSLFTGEEIAIVNQLISDHWGVTGTQISDQSHGFIGWQLAKDEETIPYSVVLVRRCPPTAAQIEYAKTLSCN